MSTKTNRGRSSNEPTTRSKTSAEVRVKAANGSGLRVVFETLLEHVSDGVLITDHHGRRVFQNPALTDLVGPSNQPAERPPPWLPEAEHDRYREYLRRYAERPELPSDIVSLEWTIMDREGRRHDVAFKIIPVPDSKGNLAALLWLIIGTEEELGKRTPERRLERAIRGLLAEVDAERTADGGGIHRDQITRDNRLTNRECEVMKLLLDGMRVASIAKELDISAHTVRNHLKSMFHKTGAHSQAELVAIIRRQDQTAG